MGKARTLFPDVRGVQYRRREHAVCPGLGARPNEVLRSEGIPEQGRSRQKCGDGVTGSCGHESIENIEVRIVEGADAVLIHRGAPDETQAVADFMQHHGHEVHLAGGHRAIQAVVPVRSVVEVGFDVCHPRLQVIPRQLVRQWRGVQDVVFGRTREIAEHTGWAGRSERIAGQVRPECIEDDGHVARDQPGPDVHGVLEGRFGLRREPIVGDGETGGALLCRNEGGSGNK